MDAFRAPREVQTLPEEELLLDVGQPVVGSSELVHLDRALPDLFHAVAADRDPNVFLDGKQIVDSVPRRQIGAIALSYSRESAHPEFNASHFWVSNFDVPNYSHTAAPLPRTDDLEEYIEATWSALTYHSPNDHGTLLGTPYPHLKPGERFAEGYYWDLQDAVTGLLTEAMLEKDDIRRIQKEQLVIGVADNIKHQIERHGYKFNGFRSYYEGRSQPPAFAAIVKAMDEYFGERKPHLMEEYLPWVVKEYEWWMKGEELQEKLSSPYASERVVCLPDGAILNRHWDANNTPRPESYQEDLETARRSPYKDPRITYRNLRAGAESGKDFTARFMDDPERLETIRASEYVTPELNSMLFEYEEFISEAHRRAGRTRQQEEFAERAEKRRNAMDTYLWNQSAGCYYDYDFKNGQQSKIKSMGTAYPVTRGAANAEQTSRVAHVLRKDLLKRGGFVSALVESDQQWDMPNGFPRDQREGAMALLHANDRMTARIAMQRWLRRDEAVFKSLGVLVEKNNVVDRNPQPGGGGEYPVQRGFLWTIGVHTEFRHLLQYA